MHTGFRDSEPTIGNVHSAFGTLEHIKEFIEDQMGELDGSIEIYEIWGELVKDEGSPDGLYIKVEGYEVLLV